MPLFSSKKRDDHHDKHPESSSNPQDSAALGKAPDGETPKPARTLPPHMQRIVDERSAPRIRPDASIEEQRNAYERRRIALQFDIDQGELASSRENPWTHRIGLLTEAIANVEAELRDAEKVVSGPYHPVPPTPITDISVTRDEGVAITFRIGDEAFAFEEVLDWAERGTQIARPELVQTSGSAAALVPGDTPPDLVEPLASHLEESAVSFATDLRDRTLDAFPLPENPTLVDLAKPCPACGGWMDWKDHCDICAARKARAQDLFRERNHLMRERSNEVEERHRLSDRLALARHRMKDLEREIAVWERTVGRT